MKLSDTKLCCQIDCNELVPLEVEECPSCLSTQFFYLWTILSPSEIRDGLEKARAASEARVALIKRAGRIE